MEPQCDPPQPPAPTAEPTEAGNAFRRAEKVCLEMTKDRPEADDYNEGWNAALFAAAENLRNAADGADRNPLNYAESRVAALEAERVKDREALKPFADWATWREERRVAAEMPPLEDDYEVTMTFDESCVLTIGHCRAARARLAQKETP